MLLRMDAHEVTIAGCAASALQQFKRKCFDLVFTDFWMPIMNGDRLAAEIKVLRPEQLICVISGYVEKFRDLPMPCFDHTLAKPISFPELRTAVSKLATRMQEQKPALG
jgi:CheY-like chemotaxis protein